MKVYLAGPMSGYEEYNFPAFKLATDTLRDDGHEVVSPAELDGEPVPGIVPGDKQWADLLARDVQVVASPDIEAVVVLPGWEDSQGAALEVHVARSLGKPILAYPDLAEVKAPTRYKPPSEENVLEEAGRIVAGDRGDEYGHPGDDFARTAGAWSSLFGWDVTPRQVALAMVVVKLSRLQETPDKRDSIVDIAGYARTYEMVMERDASSERFEEIATKADEELAVVLTEKLTGVDIEQVRPPTDESPMRGVRAIFGGIA